jgi:hypothetical protein
LPQALFVDNYPSGARPLLQPICRDEFEAPRPLHLLPFEKVYADRSVKSSCGRTTYYRIQQPLCTEETQKHQMTSLWLADRRRPRRTPRPGGDRILSGRRESDENEDDGTSEGDDDTVLLLPASHVQFAASNGIPNCSQRRFFAYLCHETIELRKRPDVGNRSRSGRYLRRGDACVASLVRWSPFSYGNGPFVLLKCDDEQALWGFERIRGGPPVLVPIEVETGSWTLQVLSQSLPIHWQPSKPPVQREQGDTNNKNDGDGLMSPIVDSSTGSSSVARLLARNEVFCSAARFENPATGIWYYLVEIAPRPLRRHCRVDFDLFATDRGANDENADSADDSGGDGWVPDRTLAGRLLLLQACSSDDSLNQTGSRSVDPPLTPWSVDFVRGVAVAAAAAATNNDIEVGVKEVSFQADQQCVMFLTGDVMVRVCCHARRVEIEGASSDKVATVERCTPQQLSAILRNPTEALKNNLQSNGGIRSGVLPFPRTSWSPLAASRFPVSDESELELRQRLANCNLKVDRLLEERRQLLDLLGPLDLRRRKESAWLLGRRFADSVASPVAASLPDGPAVAPASNARPPSAVPMASPLDPATILTEAISRALALVPSPRRPEGGWEDSVALASSAGTPTVLSQPMLVGVPPRGADEDSPTLNVMSPTRMASVDAMPSTTNGDYDAQRSPMLPPSDEPNRASPVRSEESTASSSSAGEQLNRTCGVCNETFRSARARSVHCLKEHGKFSCNYCLQVFDYTSLLNRHRDQQNHW